MDSITDDILEAGTTELDVEDFINRIDSITDQLFTAGNPIVESLDTGYSSFPADSDGETTDEESVLQPHIDEDEQRRLQICQTNAQRHAARNEYWKGELDEMISMVDETNRLMKMALESRDEDYLAGLDLEELEEDNIPGMTEWTQLYESVSDIIHDCFDDHHETLVNPYNMFLTKNGPNCLLYQYRDSWIPFLEFHGARSRESGGDENFEALHPVYNASPSPSPEPYTDDEYY